MLSRVTEWFRVLTPVLLFFLSMQAAQITARFDKMDVSIQKINDKFDRFSMEIVQRVARLEVQNTINKAD